MKPNATDAKHGAFLSASVVSQLPPSTTEPRLGGALQARIDLTEPAHTELEAHADATWGDRNVYGMLVTFNGAAVFHQIKKIALIVDSSMESEAIASSKGAETLTYVREILRAFGTPAAGPTLLTTDNLANQKVGSGVSCPSRSKHFLRRYAALRQRIAAGDVVLKHVTDPEMPADFLTKWVPSAKLEASLRYATNSRHAVLPDATEQSAPPVQIGGSVSVTP